MIRIVIDTPADLAAFYAQRAALYQQTAQSVGTKAERERFEGLGKAWAECAEIASAAILSSDLPPQALIRPTAPAPANPTDGPTDADAFPAPLRFSEELAR